MDGGVSVQCGILPREVVLNDVLVEALGLDLVRVAHGIWRFQDDPAGLERPSEPRTVY